MPERERSAGRDRVRPDSDPESKRAQEQNSSLRCFPGCRDVRMRRGSPEVKTILNYIDGQFVRGKREFADVNPADGTVIAQVSEADQSLVDDAVRAARKALHGDWGKLSIRDRAGVLRQVAAGIE